MKMNESKEEVSLREKVLQTLKSNSPISISKIAKTLEVHKRFVEKEVKKLADDGLAKYSGGRMWKYINGSDKKNG